MLQGMRRATLTFAIVFTTVGLYGMLVGHVGYLVQFDLLQSLTYTVLGFTGLKLGTENANQPAMHRYLSAVAVLNLLLFILGLTFPNFRDLVHLEVPEHVLHLTVGVWAALLTSVYRRPTAAEV